MEEAFLKAALEAYQGIEYGILLFNKELNWKENQENFENVDSFAKHFLFYNIFPEYRNEVPLIRRALESTNGAPQEYFHFTSRPENVTLDTLKSASCSKIIAIDLTTPDVESAGYSVARVIVPEFAYLTGSHSVPFLGGSAFKEKADLFLRLPHLFP
jgi:ribosomal protein S12 methylthiotransferase accessory factor